MLVLVYASNYIRALSLLLERSLGLQAEDLLLELHQLTPQGVFLSQDAGNHGLGLISGQVRLEAWEESTITQIHTYICM